MTSSRSLVADIGGTHARFALTDPTGGLHQVAVLPVAEYLTPADAVADYLRQCDHPDLTRAVIAVAAPIAVDETASLTNGRWQFDAVALRSQFGLQSLKLVNDFTALAMSLPALAESDLRQVGGGMPVVHAPKALIGPGTGLGVSGLLHAAQRWIPLTGEGGHVTLAATNAFEAEILAQARAVVPHVSAERLVSGSGLPLLHQLVGQVRGRAAQDLEAPAIMAGALSGDDDCTATIEVFCAFLGTVAGNLALTLGARGGVYVGGGIVPRLGALFDRSPFRQRFEDKGRFKEFLAEIPTYVILADAPALLGAAALLDP